MRCRSRSMLDSARALAVATALACLPAAAAHAGSIFAYEGECTPCGFGSSWDLENGDPVSGFVEIEGWESIAVGEDFTVSILAETIVDFEFTFGNKDIIPDDFYMDGTFRKHSATSFGGLGEGFAFSASARRLHGENAQTPLVTFSADGWSSYYVPSAAGTGSFALVPEPGLAALLALGPLAGAAVRARRTVRPS